MLGICISSYFKIFLLAMLVCCSFFTSHTIPNIEVPNFFSCIKFHVSIKPGVMSLCLKERIFVITGMGIPNVCDLHCRYTCLNIKLHGS